MTAIKVKAAQFTGTSKVFSREPDALAAIVRGMLIDTARLKIEVAGVHDFVDNSAGTAGANIVPLVLPQAAIDATTTGGAQTVALNTALVDIQNAGNVIVGTINEASALLGLTAMTSASGTAAVADTIAALVKVATAANGATAASFASAVAAFTAAAVNLDCLIYGANEVLVAIGATALPYVGPYLPGKVATNHVLGAIPVAAAVAVGPGAVAAADVTAFLAAYANNVATVAAAWNAAMNQGTPGAGALHVVAG